MTTSQPQFEEGDIVAEKNNTSCIYQVIIDHDAEHLISADEDNVQCLDSHGSVHELPRSTLRKIGSISFGTDEYLYNLINEHVRSLINKTRDDRGLDESISLSIEVQNYAGARDIDISYNAYVKSGETVKTRSLAKSLQLATDRFFENKANEPLSLPRN